MTSEQIQEKISPILHEHDVVFAGLFGSFARGDANEKSDIDIVVRFKKPQSLLQFFALQNALESALDHDVDLATERALHPLLRNAILKELRPLYGKR